TVPGDSREMALRIYGGSWDGRFEGGARTEPLRAGAGAWFADRWMEPESSDVRGMLAFNGSEMILRAPDAGEHRLSFDVAPLDGAPELILTDGAGRTLWQGIISEARRIDLD